MENFAALFGRVEESLRERGAYYRRNRGVFSYGLENIDFLPQIGLPRSQQRDARAGASARSTSCAATRSRCSAVSPASPGRCGRS